MSVGQVSVTCISMKGDFGLLFHASLKLKIFGVYMFDLFYKTVNKTLFCMKLNLYIFVLTIQNKFFYILRTHINLTFI